MTSVETSLDICRWRNFTFGKITTADGVVGWGEATLGWKEIAVKELIEDGRSR